VAGERRFQVNEKAADNEVGHGGFTLKWMQ
jgi:hypothetical protein